VIAWRRWESETRYYAVSIDRDLLGDLVLVRYNGGKRSRLGAMRTTFLPSIEAGQREMARIERRRRQRRYVEVTGPA
jgi:predicted DNA-binding WGR domain protein